MTRHDVWLLHAPLLTALTALAAGAQTEPPARPEADTARPKEAQHHADDRVQPVVVRLRTVIGTELANGKGDKLGRIDDLVVDTSTGRITDAVIGISATLGLGEKRTAVRWESVNWDGEHKRFTYEVTKEQLETAPAFHADHLEGGQPTLKDASAGKHDADGAEDKPPITEPQGQKDQAAPQAAKAQSTRRLASKLVEFRVTAASDDLGVCSDIYPELRTGNIAFVAVTLGDVLGVGGKTYPMPWSALTVRLENEKRPRLQLAGIDRKQLEHAPTTEGKDDLEIPTFRGRIYQFYGVRLPVYEPDHDLMGKLNKRIGEAEEKR